MFDKTVTAFRGAAERKRMKNELRQARDLSDHMLKDMGITRSDIDAAIRSL